MSGIDKAVRSSSMWSSLRMHIMHWRASYSRTLVKRVMTSKLTIISPFSTGSFLILSTNSAEFFTWDSVIPDSGDRILVSSLAKWCVGEPLRILVWVGYLVCGLWIVHNMCGGFENWGAGAAMGSPLSPVVANVYMEQFEKQALATSRIVPNLWIRYVDDTFVTWAHGEGNLNKF